MTDLARDLLLRLRWGTCFVSAHAAAYVRFTYTGILTDMGAKLQEQGGARIDWKKAGRTQATARASCQAGRRND